MNLVVLDGSPKGEHSITLQYARFLAATHPEHQWSFVEVARKIGVIRQDEEVQRTILDQLAHADAIVWCFPVYFLSVPAQLKNFIELLFERGMHERLRGRYATALSSSAHFFDNTARDYVHAISEDLGLLYVKGYSAESFDLLRETERTRLQAFAAHFLLQGSSSG